MTSEPHLKKRDGLLTATVWENTVSTEDGEKTRLSIHLVRNYKDGEDWKETSSFSPSELLKVARLAERTYDAILRKRQSDKEGAK